MYIYCLLEIAILLCRSIKKEYLNLDSCQKTKHQSNLTKTREKKTNVIYLYIFFPIDLIIFPHSYIFSHILDNFPTFLIIFPDLIIYSLSLPVVSRGSESCGHVQGVCWRQLYNRSTTIIPGFNDYLVLRFRCTQLDRCKRILRPIAI